MKKHVVDAKDAEIAHLRKSLEAFASENAVDSSKVPFHSVEYLICNIYV